MGGLRAWEAVRSGGAHSIFLIKKYEVSHGFLPGQAVFW